MMTISNSGLNLLKQFEGCRLKSYRDSGGIWTIGVGCTGTDIGPGKVITDEEAMEMLAGRLLTLEHELEKLIKVPVTQNEFDAIVCLTYNIGIGAFAKSSVLHYLNTGNKIAAADAFNLWNKINGKPVEGLIKRRSAERALFTTEGK